MDKLPSTGIIPRPYCLIFTNGQELENITTAYLAPIGLEDQLRSELQGTIYEFGRLFLSDTPLQKSVWAANIWQDVKTIPIQSIGDGAKKLKSLAPFWGPYYQAHIRRAKLIQDKLPRFSGKRLKFLQDVPQTPLGAWTLLDANLILASTTVSSPRINGEWEFQEDKEAPPSRAYLKLWEVFTRLKFRPRETDTCLEVGASPGGWSWVLAGLCKKVITYDRADLAPNILNLPTIIHHRGDAFKVTPQTHPEVDWVFSDIICTPERLYEWLQPWLLDTKPRNFCLTIKLKGDDYQSWIDKFAAIKNSRIVHLYHNKHELTFILLNKEIVG